MWVARWMSCKILGAKTACQTIPQLKFIPSHSPVLHRCQQAPKSSRYYRYISPPPYKSNPIHNIPGMILFQSRVLLTSKIQLAEGKASQQLLRRAAAGAAPLVSFVPSLSPANGVKKKGIYNHSLQKASVILKKMDSPGLCLTHSRRSGLSGSIGYVWK